MAIVWGPVIQAGAEAAATAFGTAFGTSVGQGLGDALVKAILGQGNSVDADMQELKATLARLEAKIDGLIRYVTNVLPGLIYDGGLMANLAVEMEKHKALHTAVEAQLAAYRESATEGNADQLITATTNFLVNAKTLMGFGVPYYAFGVQATVTATAAYWQLISNDVPGQGAALQVWGKSFVDLMEPWLNDVPDTTIRAQRTSCQAALAESQPIANAFPSGVPHFVLTTWGPEKQENVGGFVGVTAYNYKVLVGYFDRQNGTWWTGGDPFTTFASVMDAPAADGDWERIVRDVSVGGSHQRPLVLPWCPPMKDHPINWHFGDYFSHAARIYNAHVANAATLPARIDGQTVVLERIRAASSIWAKYATGEA